MPRNIFVSRKLSVTSLLAIFVLIFTVAAASAVVVFGYAEGPPAGENGWPGGTGLNCTSCHTSFALNSPASNSGITISGFPTSSYVPGQQYTLNITVGLIGPQTSPPRSRYGFQISSRSTSNPGNPQAGTFALIGNTGFDTAIGFGTTTAPTAVNGIVYVSHNAFGTCQGATSCTWQVSWTAPPDTSLGTIEFDIAGNSANGDFTNQNDYILTKAITASPTAPSLPPQFASSNPSFPHIGGIRGGTPVTLNGSNFVNGAVVFFGANQVGTSFVSSSQLTAVSPSTSTAGPVDLKVQNPDGKSATLAGAFTYFDDSTLKIAYAVATPTTSKQADVAATSEAPVGSGIFSFSQNNVLVTTVGTASATPTNSFLMFASSKPFNSVNGPIPNNTGVAIINRSGSTANLTFTLIKDDGTIKAGPQPGPALADGAHLQGFITDANFFGAAADNFNGTMKVDSTQPVSALTLQLTTNQHNESLFTSFPVADLTQPPPVGAKLVFAHLLGGSGFQTVIVLMNTTNNPISGNVLLVKDSPSMPGFDFGTGPIAQIPYSIPPLSEQAVTSIGTGALTDGFAVVVPDAGKATPVGTGVFVLTQGSFTVTTAGVPSSPAIQSGLIFVDTNPTSSRLTQDTGVALANPSSTQTADVSFKLRNLADGQVVASKDLSQVPGHHALSPNSHDALFVDQIFTNGEANNFTGTLSIETASPDGISALTLLQTNNQRGDSLLTTLPVATEFSSTAPVFFPQLVAFQDFQTQLILLNPSGSTSSSGTLNFFNELGSPLALPLNDQVNSSFGYNLPSKGGSSYK